jgi:phosphohistidine phosphatase
MLPAADRLVAIVRHAKAEPGGPTDFERALAERGRRDAAAAGVWLAEEGFAADHALVSAARRAHETWEALAGGAGWDPDPELDRGLYAADPDTALDLIRLTGDDVRRLVVVGHNPTMALVAQLLVDGDGESDLEDRLASDFPTSAVAVFAFEASWADVVAGSGRLVGFHVGRG